MKTVCILGAFDTKGKEFKYVKDLIEAQGLNTFCIHTGTFDPIFTPDVSNKEVAAAGGGDIDEIVARKERDLATETLSKGCEKLIPQLYAEGKFDGIIAMGGSGGSSMSAPGMRKLPLGVPKILCSTVAAGDVSFYVGQSDLIMMPSVVDVEGLNEISMSIFQNAANAIAGMVKNYKKVEGDGKPLVACTMFGVTTPCIKMANAYLEKEGFAPLVFHATGTGGSCMEALVRQGWFKGVLDLTTTEWCDEVGGGILSAGPTRCTAAADCGIPQVASLGATDMINFGPLDTLPENFRDRNIFKHNPTTTLVRTNKDECLKIATELVKRWNTADPKKIAVMLPLKGVSMIDAEGQPFYGPEEDKIMFDYIRANLNKDIELVELDLHVNDEDFAVAIAKKLIELVKANG